MAIQTCPGGPFKPWTATAHSPKHMENTSPIRPSLLPRPRGTGCTVLWNCPVRMRAGPETLPGPYLLQLVWPHQAFSAFSPRMLSFPSFCPLWKAGLPLASLVSNLWDVSGVADPKRSPPTTQKTKAVSASSQWPAGSRAWGGLGLTACLRPCLCPSVPELLASQDTLPQPSSVTAPQDRHPGRQPAPPPAWLQHSPAGHWAAQ